MIECIATATITTSFLFEKEPKHNETVSTDFFNSGPFIYGLKPF
jgi:hypothetical protein